jgi:hypothetical protein
VGTANRRIIAICVFAAFAAPVRADNSPADNSPIPPSVRLDLAAMPKIDNQNLQNAIIGYDKAAKAWWIELRCKIGTAEEHKLFQDDLAAFTGMMDKTFQDSFNVPPENANKFSQTVQMYALNEMSANQFYGCGEQAKELWLKGFTVTKQLVEFASRKAEAGPH